MDSAGAAGASVVARISMPRAGATGSSKGCATRAYGTERKWLHAPSRTPITVPAGQVTSAVRAVELMRDIVTRAFRDAFYRVFA